MLLQAVNTSGCIAVDLTNWKKSLRNTRLGFYPAPEAFSILKGMVEKKRQLALSRDPGAHVCVRLELGNPIRLLIHPRSGPGGEPGRGGRSHQVDKLS